MTPSSQPIDEHPRPKIRCALFGHAWRRAFGYEYRPFLLRCRRCETVGPVDPHSRHWD